MSPNRRLAARREAQQQIGSRRQECVIFSHLQRARPGTRACRATGEHTHTHTTAGWARKQISKSEITVKAPERKRTTVRGRARTCASPPHNGAHAGPLTRPPHGGAESRLHPTGLPLQDGSRAPPTASWADQCAVASPARATTRETSHGRDAGR